MYAVILAGGGGTRLRPLSTAALPKPFLPLLGTRSLLQLTVDRLAGLVAPADVYVVTDRAYGAAVREQLPQATVLEEPMGRNTAAAVALAVAAIERDDDEVMAVFPADHLIGDGPIYRGVVRAAEVVATGACGVVRPLVTLGIQPSFAATGYGYLRPDMASHQFVEGLHVHRLAAFFEKPSQADAERLIREPGVAWNAGIFVAQRRALRSAFVAHAPGIIGPVGRGQARYDLGSVYGALEARSIDHAIMEAAASAGEVVMVGMNLPWSDLGSWSALLEALGAPGVKGSVLEPGRRATLGAGDLVVRRLGAGLAVEAGPGTIAGEPGPCALLVGAAAQRGVVEALLDRVAAVES